MVCLISFIFFEVVFGVKVSKWLWNDMERKNCDFWRDCWWSVGFEDCDWGRRGECCRGLIDRICMCRLWMGGGVGVWVIYGFIVVVVVVLVMVVVIVDIFDKLYLKVMLVFFYVVLILMFLLFFFLFLGVYGCVDSLLFFLVLFFWVLLFK